MKVYIAASFAARERLRPIRDQLWKLGHEVVSSWLDETVLPKGMTEEEFFTQLAVKDLAEVKAADAVIQDTITDSTTGGSHVEFGMALSQLKVKYVVGKPRSIFHQLADKQFDNWDDAISYITMTWPSAPHAVG